jgi:hypothetical protein
MQELGRLSLGGGGESIYTISIHFFTSSLLRKKNVRTRNLRFSLSVQVLKKVGDAIVNIV